MREKPGRNLAGYDVIVVSTSAGKDSQAMLDLVCVLARQQGCLDRVHAVHCDLGRAEWAGTRELAQRQCDAYQVPLHVISRPQGDLLDHVAARGMWPSPKQRYCTSDHKRDQAAKVIRRLANEAAALKPKGSTIKVLSCTGLRAEESPARAKRETVTTNKRLATKTREVTEWLPIHDWTEQDVWDRIEQSRVPHHPAYDLGMPRLSCVFCIFAPKAALVLAGRHNRELLDTYCEVEANIGHTFRQDLSLADIRKLVDTDIVTTCEQGGCWNM